MSSSFLRIKSKTWNRESHGLFDYDTNQLSKSILKVPCSGSLIRENSDIQFLPENSSPISATLLQLLALEDSFIIYPAKNEPVSLVISKTSQYSRKGFKLSTGDVLKLGRVKLKVRSICNEEKTKEKNLDEFEGSNNGELYCKFCFRTHSNKIDPLVSVCKCAGSLELVHINCLRTYAMSKAIVKINLQCVTYCWKNFQCDVCKVALPMSVEYGGEAYDTIPDLAESQTKCIVLQDYRQHKYRIIVHVLKYAQIPIIIGRSTDSDLKINDISVSRSHACIELFNNNFYIKDNSSKFGTLIVQKRPIIINKSFSPTLQIGRSLLSFSYKSQSKVLYFFSKCCKKYNKVDTVPKSRTELIWEEISLRSSQNANDSN
jgi:hypothetical protein